MTVARCSMISHPPSSPPSPSSRDPMVALECASRFRLNVKSKCTIPVKSFRIFNNGREISLAFAGEEKIQNRGLEYIGDSETFNYIPYVAKLANREKNRKIRKKLDGKNWFGKMYLNISRVSNTNDT